MKFEIFSPLTRKTMSFAGVRRTSIKDIMEKPVLLAKDKPKETGSIVKSLPSKVYPDVACMNEIKRRDKDSGEGYVNEYLEEIDNLVKEKKGKGKDNGKGNGRK